METDRRLVGTVEVAILLMLFGGVGCSSRSSDTSRGLRLDLDRKDPKSFISYYFGGLASSEGTDPFAAGLVSEMSGDYFLDTTALYTAAGSSVKLHDENQDGTLDWDELSPFLEATYYSRRRMPLSFDSLDVHPDDKHWFEVAVDGVMTTATRRIHVPLSSLRSALARYKEMGNRLVYPLGTIMIANHVANDRTVETTVMRKWGDGYWDFGVYDSTGSRIPATTTPPKPLTVPTQCAGCHLGSRLYEPEKSFPGVARPGPEGPRAVHWPGQLPSPELVRYFDEHRKRSDGILGLYGTLYVAGLQAKRDGGTISDDDKKLLESLGL